MSPSERNELLEFLERVLRKRVDHKDRVAQDLILERCASHPDALYLLVQRAMALEALLAPKTNPQAESQDLALASNPPQSAPSALEPESPWRRGLWAQATPWGVGLGIGLGLAAGVAAGEELLHEMGEDLFGDD